jgi:hypothetical protein
MKGACKVLDGVKVGGKKSNLKVKGDYKPDTVGKKVTKMPTKKM